MGYCGSITQGDVDRALSEGRLAWLVERNHRCDCAPDGEWQPEITYPVAIDGGYHVIRDPLSRTGDKISLVEVPIAPSWHGVKCAVSTYRVVAGVSRDACIDQRIYAAVVRYSGGAIRLAGADLQRGDFQGADLRGADLLMVDLRYADLACADLRGADLRNSDLRGAHSSGANLSGADLCGADLSGADLSDVDLRGADLRGADLSGADLRGADLSGADLRGADLSGADLRGADLTGADLCGADLTGADLCGADLTGEVSHK
jgi:hypothetical protein